MTPRQYNVRGNPDIAPLADFTRREATAGLTGKGPSTMTFLSRLAHDQTGATAVEYAIIASLVVIAMVAAVGGLGALVGNSFDNTATSFADTQ